MYSSSELHFSDYIKKSSGLMSAPFKRLIIDLLFFGEIEKTNQLRLVVKIFCVTLTPVKRPPLHDYNLIEY